VDEKLYRKLYLVEFDSFCFLDRHIQIVSVAKPSSVGIVKHRCFITSFRVSEAGKGVML
jgi:hypothetical protein